MSVPFISSADLSAYLRDDVIDSNLASIALDAACERVRGYCNQELGATSVVDEYVHGTGTKRLILPVFPITGSVTITTYANDRTSPEVLVEDTDYVVNPKTGIAYLVNGNVFPFGTLNVKVSYDYGHATVPSDARLVALQVAARIYAVGMVTSESAGGVNATYVEGAGNLTPDEKDSLRRYRVA